MLGTDHCHQVGESELAIEQAGLSGDLLKEDQMNLEINNNSVAKIDFVEVPVSSITEAAAREVKNSDLTVVPTGIEIYGDGAVNEGRPAAADKQSAIETSRHHEGDIQKEFDQVVYKCKYTNLRNF